MTERLSSIALYPTFRRSNPASSLDSVANPAVGFSGGGVAQVSNLILKGTGAAQKDTLLQLSHWFLTMPERFGMFSRGAFNTLFPSAKTNPAVWDKSIWQKVSGFFTNRILPQDYHHTAFVPYVGRMIVEPPAGALFAILFPFTVGGRLKHAVNRMSEGDNREIRDILMRDIPSISVFLYMLQPTIKWLSGKLEKIGGIRLLANSGTPYTYDALEDIYTVHSPLQLKSMLSFKQNQTGVLRAIDKTLANRGLKNERGLLGLLRQFRQHIQNGFRVSSANGFNVDLHGKRLDQHAQKAFEALQQLETLRTQKLFQQSRALKQGLSNSMLRRFVDKLMGSFDNQIPAFKKMFASYTMGKRVWTSLFSYAVVVGLLGFGITWFIKTFTEREYAKKLKEAQNYGPASQFKNAGFR